MKTKKERKKEKKAEKARVPFYITMLDIGVVFIRFCNSKMLGIICGVIVFILVLINCIYKAFN